MCYCIYCARIVSFLEFYRTKTIRALEFFFPFFFSPWYDNFPPLTSWCIADKKQEVENHNNRLLLSISTVIYGMINAFFITTVQCSPGYEDIAGTCRMCKIGFYKSEYAAALCRECPSGFITSEEGAIQAANCTVRKFCWNFQCV
jgi:hypothetical protein